MYEYIRGTVTFIGPYYLVIETGGIGYQIATANPFRFSGQYNQTIQIYVYQSIREDAHTLYGFATLTEKQLFIKLISVSGIGPKSALAILAGEDPGGLIQAIELEDSTYLTKFPGVGKKTAQQMVLDLKGKLGELATSEVAVTALGKAERAKTTSVNPLATEALEALRALGYSERELKQIEKSLVAETYTSTDEYLRFGLRLLMKK